MTTQHLFLILVSLARRCRATRLEPLPRAQRHGRRRDHETADRGRADDQRRVEDGAAAGAFLAGAHRVAHLSHRAHRRQDQLPAAGHRARPRDGQGVVAARGAARKTGRIENVNGPASPSPVTDGESVYAFFQEFGLISFTADGKERWRLPLGPFNIYYGFGASPMLVDDLLILPVDQDLGAYLVAIDRRTGKERWQVERPHVISGYSTPTLYRPAGGPAQVVIPESFQLTSYAVADGRKLWWVRGLACEMKSVASLDGQTLYVNGWGFPQNQPGRQVRDGAVRRRAEAVRQERRRAGRQGRGRRRPADGQDARRRLRLPRLRPRPRREAGRARMGRRSARCSARRTGCSRSRLAARAT